MHGAIAAARPSPIVRRIRPSHLGGDALRASPCNIEKVPAQNHNQRIDVINALRAFAATFVAWGHFVAGQGKYLGWSGKYGYLGVDIFFVISGFVIPWSLYRSGYVLRDYARFLLKRNVRLYPPYLASIVATLLATNLVLVPLFHVPRLTVTGHSLLLHFTYLNDLVGVPWVNVAYWTLAMRPRMVHPGRSDVAAVSEFPKAGTICSSGGDDGRLFRVSQSAPGFQQAADFSGWRLRFSVPLASNRFVRNVRADPGDGGLMLWPIGWIVASVSVATGLIIALSTFHNRAADFVGDISYSLYLLHLPIGVAVIGCLSHWLPYSSSYIGVLDVVGLVASGLAAWIMYQLIEKPSQVMSSAIRFAHRAVESPPAAVAAAASAD